MPPEVFVERLATYSELLSEVLPVVDDAAKLSASGARCETLVRTIATRHAELLSRADALKGETAAALRALLSKGKGILTYADRQLGPVPPTRSKRG